MVEVIGRVSFRLCKGGKLLNNLIGITAHHSTKSFCTPVWRLEPFVLWKTQPELAMYFVQILTSTFIFDF